MKLSNITYYVPDVQATVEFYEQAFGLKRQFIADENQYAQLSTGEVALGFAAQSLVESMGINFSRNENGNAPGFEISLSTPNVAAALERALKHGAILHSDLAHRPWGQTVVHVKGINGFIVELCTPMEH